MAGKWQFYFRHSLNDLRVNGQRTLFALLCIAAGVAAIVSLQTLGVMIQTTLTDSLQRSNRGDIRIEAFLDTFGEDEEALAQVGRDGLVTPGSEADFNDHFSQEGLERMRAWMQENFPGQIEMTYQHSFGAPLNVSATTSDTIASFITGYVVDTAVFPYYGTITVQDDRPLAEVIQNPTDVVIDRTLQQKLAVEIGDAIRISGATEPFTVVGIVKEGSGGFEQAFTSIFGYLYIDLDGLVAFPDEALTANTLFWRLQDPAQVAEVSQRLRGDYPYLDVTDTEDLREQNELISGNVLQLVSIMGLLSLLIGGIGIVNTMQVIVRRRTVEIAVLKTVGMQAPQVTTLFLVEAFLMGIIGSVLGILLGWGLTFALRGAAGAFLARDIPFAITPGPALTGFVVGTLVTTIFGFLPTLSAGLVRPGLVLRPQDEIVPRAGLLRSLLALVVVIIVLQLIAATFIGTAAAFVVPGAFLVIGILYALLSLLIWIVGRFFPSFGSLDLKVALRSMLASRPRGASTLLALAVGVFTLSLITLITGTILGVFQQILVEETGGNVIIFAPAFGDTLDRVQGILDETDGVNSYTAVETYTISLVSVEDGATGAVETVQQIKDKIDAAGITGPAAAFVDEDEFQPSSTFDFAFNSIDARNVLSNLPAVSLRDGRQLTPEDAGQPVAVLTYNDQFATAGIEVGDRITVAFESSRLRLFGLGSDDAPTATFEIVGLREQGAVSLSAGTSGIYAPLDVFPEGASPTSLSAIVDVEEENIGQVRRALEGTLGVFVLETKLLNDVLNQLIGQFTSFPIIVAALSLIVGGIVIANSVALSTLERRREIAIMKAVGLQRERVLLMLLLENGLLGLIGGIIGVGIGLVILLLTLNGLVTGAGTAITANSVPYGSAFVLMLLCVGIALAAAMVTAWGASGDKPLNVLRYE